VRDGDTSEQRRSRSSDDHERAGPLCIAMWITCAKRRIACVRCGERLGIVLPPPGYITAFTWEAALRALCIKERSVIVHTPHRNN